MSNSIDQLHQATRNLFWGKRSNTRPQIKDLTWDHIDREKVNELRVMVSSPLTSLQGTRTILRDWLLRLPTVRVSFFEFEASEGHGPHRSSISLVDDADIIVILFGDKSGSRTGSGDETFSQLEFDALRAKQARLESFGRPRVFVYKHTARQLEGWEIDASSDFGHREILDENMLAMQIFMDVSAALILERQAQGYALFALKDLLIKERTAANEVRERHESIINQLRLSHEAEIGTLGTLRESLQRQVKELGQHDETRESKIAAANAARDIAQAGMNRAVLNSARRIIYAGVVGLGIGIFSAVALIGALRVLGSDSTQLLNASGRIVTSLDAIADRIAARPAIIEAKIAIAKRINSGFDCARRNTHVWTLSSISGARFEREEICESWGAFILRIDKQAHNCEVDVLTPSDAHFLAQTFAAERHVIQFIRIVGRASTDHIDKSCGEVPSELLPGRDVQAGDRQIHTNSELARLRASMASVRLEEQLRKLNVALDSKIVIQDSLGVLDRRSDPQGPTDDRDRGVDIEIYTVPDPTERAIALR